MARTLTLGAIRCDKCNNFGIRRALIYLGSHGYCQDTSGAGIARRAGASGDLFEDDLPENRVLAARNAAVIPRHR